MSNGEEPLSLPPGKMWLPGEDRLSVDLFPPDWGYIQQPAWVKYIKDLEDIQRSLEDEKAALPEERT